MITRIINNFYKQTIKGNNYKQIHSDALCYPQEREAIIMDMEDALYEMIELHELTRKEKLNYRLWSFAVSELKIWHNR